MNQAIPPGKAMGCLPRKYAPGEVCPFIRDRIPIIPEEEWSKWAGKVSMRDLCPTVLDQDGVGSCATESTTMGVMVARVMQGQPFELLNPWYIYRVTSGGSDRGSSIDENLVYAREHGIAPERLHPRSLGWRTRPSAEAVEAAKSFRIDEFYDITTIDEMVSALLSGFAVVYGANGHSVIKIEHQNDREGLDLNSWGRGWGDEGFGVWVPYSGVNWYYGAYAIRTALADQIVEPPA